MNDVEKYGAVIVYDHNGVPRSYVEGMPFFLMLGQDEFVPGAIEDYAARVDRGADAAEAEGDDARAAHLRGQAEAARAKALRIGGWQIENPELTKLPD